MPMTDDQIAFFRALCAPFGRDQLGTKPVPGKGSVTYAKARTLMNRLDDVAGVDGWFPEYRANDKGFTCRLHVRIPAEDGPAWLWKEDGAGAEATADADNNEKGAYTNAFRRACSAWGISRYLYREGTPAYLGDQPAPEPAAARHDDGRRDTPPPARNNGPPPRNQSSPPPQRDGNGYDNFRAPRGGKGAFAWAKHLEEHFQYGGIVRLMNDFLKDELGFDGRLVEMDESQTREVCWHAIDAIKAWDTYRGEFDHLEDPRDP